jgi:hypothetical protein
MIRIPIINLEHEAPVIHLWFSLCLKQSVHMRRVALGLIDDNNKIETDMNELYNHKMSESQQRIANQITYDWTIANYQDYCQSPKLHERFKKIFEQKYKDKQLRIIME